MTDQSEGDKREVDLTKIWTESKPIIQIVVELQKRFGNGVVMFVSGAAVDAKVDHWVVGEEPMIEQENRLRCFYVVMLILLQKGLKETEIKEWLRKGNCHLNDKTPGCVLRETEKMSELRSVIDAARK